MEAKLSPFFNYVLCIKHFIEACFKLHKHFKQSILMTIICLQKTGSSTFKIFQIFAFWTCFCLKISKLKQKSVQYYIFIAVLFYDATNNDKPTFTAPWSSTNHRPIIDFNCPSLWLSVICRILFLTSFSSNLRLTCQ